MYNRIKATQSTATRVNEETTLNFQPPSAPPSYDSIDGHLALERIEIRQELPSDRPPEYSDII